MLSSLSSTTKIRWKPKTAGESTRGNGRDEIWDSSHDSVASSLQHDEYQVEGR